MRFTSAARRSRRLQLALAVIAILLAAAAVVLARGYIERQRQHRRFGYEIRLAERLIADRRLEQAERRVRAAAEFAAGERAWLQVLKRAHRIDELTEQPALLHELAPQAVAAVPGEEVLHAVAVQAALGAGEYAEAAERAVAHLHSDQYAAVRAEALIAAEAYPTDPAPHELEAMHPFMRLAAAETPERHLQAYDLTGDARFVVNAALLYLARGNPEQAAMLLDGVDLPAEAALIAALVAYELGEYERARGALQQIPAEAAVDAPVLLLHAELELRAGRPEEARRVYEELQVTDPDHSAIAWYNHTIVTEDRNERLDLLAEALQRFPGDLRLVWAYVEAGGDPEAVAGALAEPYRALLRFYAAQPDGGGGPRAVARLWELHNEYPDNEAIAAALARKLVAVSDRSGLERVINRFAERDDAHWARQYEGWLAHHRGALQQAGAALEEGYAPRRLWQSAHNRAVYAVLQRDPAAVAEALAPARVALEGLPGFHVQRAKLAHLRALGAYLEGEVERARDYVLEAIAEDPNNFELRRFLRNLETALH